MVPYPLIFKPILKPKVWGGLRLENLGKQLPPEEPIGESWEIADLPPEIDGGRSVIANGELAGKTLHEIVKQYPKEILGPRYSELLEYYDGFPLLIKYLDACDNLSVQVHPDEKYAKAHADAHLKSEAWVVVAAEPGSVIYKGVKQSVTAEDFARHIETGEVVDDLIAIEVKPGDCHYLPSGTCHALGAGVLVAEVQTPSDTTFRVFDWGRTSRELHIKQALECITFGEQSFNTPDIPTIDGDGFETTQLCQTEYFTIECIRADAGKSLPIVTNGSAEVWMVLVGSGVIETDNAESSPISAGLTLLMPAYVNNSVVLFDINTSLLRVTLPSAYRGVIA